jgi:carnitine-CoA ligase
VAVDTVERIPLAQSTISYIFGQRLREAPEAAFVRVHEDELTYAEVDAASRSIAAALVAAGIERSEIVAQLMPTRTEYLTTYIATSRLGIAMMPINMAFRDYMLEYVLNDAAPRLIFVTPEMLGVLAESESQFEKLESVVVHDASEADLARAQKQFSRLRLGRWEDFLASADVDALETRGFDSVTPDDPNCVIYTSGTTGPSKGVVLQNSVTVSKALDVVRICELRSDDVMYCPAPLFHSLALIRGFVGALLSGASVVFRERFSVTEYWKDAAALKATVGLTTNVFVGFLKNEPPTPYDRAHRLRCLYPGPTDHEFEERFNVRVMSTYGMTEASLPIYALPDDVLPDGAVGRVGREWNVRIADTEGNELPAGSIGEILMRPLCPGMIMQRYLNKPEATLEVFRDLWFHTGDLGSVDDDGVYYFYGRSKDAIRRRGENISAWEVEKMIRQHPDIVEIAALPYPAPEGEEEVWVLAVVAEGSQLTARDLHAFASERLPSFMVPRYVELRESFPRTGIGKIAKHELRETGLGKAVFDAGEHKRRSRAESK